MLRWVPALALASWCGVARAGTAIEGVIVDHDSGAPVADATVFGAHDGVALTDDAGHFALAPPPGAPRDRALTIVASGYASTTVAAGHAPLTIRLLPVAAGEVIEVAAKAPVQTKPLSYKLTAAEAHLIPGAGNDILRAVQVLPGVARIPYSFGGLVLRGASPNDTEVYLDGIEVPIAFHFGGFTSFYPSDMLDNLAVTPSGFGVAYGRAEGGLVTLTTRAPRTDRWRAGGHVGLLDSGAIVEGPVGGGGVIAGVRWSYFDLLARPFVEADLPLPGYWDAQVKGSFGDPAHAGQITPLVFTSIDRISGSTVGITSAFVRAAAPYLKQWGPLALHVVPWIGTDQLSFESTENGATETYRRPVYRGGLRADLTRDWTWGDVAAGLDEESGYLAHSQMGFTGQNEGPQQSNGGATVAWSDLALWGSTRVRIDGDRFAIKPGVRVEAYGLSHEVVIDPRLAITQRLSDTLTLRQAIGRYHQPPTAADIDPQNGNPDLKSSYFDQASLGLDWKRGATQVSLTAFYALGQRLGVRESRAGDVATPDLGGLGPTFELLLERQLGFSFYRENVGRARDMGIELAIRRQVGRWFGLVAYTLSRAQRVDDPTVAPGWRPFELDQRHDLNLAGSVALGGWRLGARVQVVTGNPYSPTVVVGGQPVQQPWAGRLPTFFQLDLRADHTWHTGWGDVVFYADIQNATNNNNIEGREYDGRTMADKDIPGLPIIPFLGVELTPR